MRAALAVFAIFAIMLAPCLAHAEQHSRLSGTSGAKLMRVCAPNYGPAQYTSDFARNAVAIKVCEAYITGIYDTMSQMQSGGAPQVACVPDSANADPIRMQVVQWLSQHPDDANKQASSVVLHVLQQNYPCNGAPQASAGPEGPVVTHVPGAAYEPLHLPHMPTPDEAMHGGGGSMSQSIPMPSAAPPSAAPANHAYNAPSGALRGTPDGLPANSNSNNDIISIPDSP